MGAPGEGPSGLVPSAVEPQPVDVVWWRSSTAATEVPKTYGLGWCRADGMRTGTHSLQTPHRWVSGAVIEGELAATLTEFLGGPVALRPAIEDEPNPVVRLARAGHRIIDVDLSTSYGLDVVGGVVAHLVGRGVRGVVVMEQYLSPAVRLAVAQWAEDALNAFGAATHRAHVDGGWQQFSGGRWQLLARQAARSSSKLSP